MFAEISGKTLCICFQTKQTAHKLIENYVLLINLIPKNVNNYDLLLQT